MKKTIITLFALAGVAMGTEQLLTLPDSTTTTSATLITNKGLGTTWDAILSTTSSYDYGLYYGGQNGALGTFNTSEGSWTNTDNVGSITMNGRDGVGGAAFVMVLGEELTAGTVITSITLSATNQDGRVNLGNADNKKGGNVTLGLGIVDSDGNILHSNGGNTINVGAAGNTNTEKIELTNAITWQEGYKVVAVFDGTYGNLNFASVAYTLKDVTVTATTIPEPATATLSLLVLAGLAVRRRRR